MAAEDLPIHGSHHGPDGPDPIVGIGDYVFIAEIEIEATSVGPIEFVDIPQTYRHLVLEASVAGKQTLSSGPDDLYVLWGPGEVEFDDRPDYLDGFASMQQHALNTVAFPSFAPEALDPASSDVAVRLAQILPGAGEFDQEDGTGIYANITFKFPYYRRADRRKAVRWEAIALVPLDEGENVTGVENSAVTHSVGGGVQGTPGTGPFPAIEKILLDSYYPPGGFMVGSVASLYGIR